MECDGVRQVARSRGRSSTRRLEQTLQFDHGAQYFTCKDPRVAKYVCSWMTSGLASVWSGRIVEWRDREIVAEKSNANRIVVGAWHECHRQAFGKGLVGPLSAQSRQHRRGKGQPTSSRGSLDPHPHKKSDSKASHLIQYSSTAPRIRQCSCFPRGLNPQKS